MLGGERASDGGTGASALDRVTTCRRVRNVAPAPRTRYELDPEATLAAVDAFEAAGEDLVGFYHSHPTGPAEPSATDRTQATWSGYVYCIVLPREDAVRAWRWTGDRFDPLDVVDEP